MIKLVVSDIDGTLVGDGGSELNPELLETILRLKEQGIYFAAASGRHTASIEYLFHAVRDQIFYIGDNGAYVGCYGRSLFQTEYDPELAASMLADIKAAGLDILVDCADCVYTDSQNEAFLSWLSGGYHFRMKQLADIRTLREPIIKISACRMDGVQAFLKPLEEKYGERLKITLSGQQWIDTMDPQVNKGNAVRILQEGLQISPTETFAFGDQLNDMEMLGQAYYSFAVANARPETKQAARFVCDSNERDGVLKILRLRLVQTASGTTKTGGE